MAVLGSEITVFKHEEADYVSLTDIAKYKWDKVDLIVQNWMRNRNTIEFLWLWEQLNNQEFKPLEFEGFRKEAGLNAFLMSPKKWIDSTGAIWLLSKSGKSWWTFAHKDIAIEFANWISVEFRLYFIKEFQRLKEQEVKSLDRNVKRFLTKVNYKIHTDAIKDHLIPQELSQEQINFIYADEADVLNTALFGQTAKQWRQSHSKSPWNVRDEATIEQLIVLANIESMNAEYIKLQMPQAQRLQLLNQTAITQMRSLVGMKVVERFPQEKSPDEVEV